MEDLNTPEYLAKIQRAIYENLREKEAAPGIQMQSEFALRSWCKPRLTRLSARLCSGTKARP